MDQMENLVQRIHQWFHDGYEVLLAQNDMYERIESALQKQEALNRLMIKRELEFKEYQKSMQQELCH